jgi:hypothetical protein
MRRIHSSHNWKSPAAEASVKAAGGVLGLLKLQSAHPEWAFRALLAMGTIEMLLGIWIGFWSRNRRRSAFAVLTSDQSNGFSSSLSH